MSPKTRSAESGTGNGSPRGEGGRSTGSRRARDKVGSGADLMLNVVMAAEGLSASREGIAAYPLLSVAGGLTAGIALGMLLPRSRREQDLLSDVGHKVTETAREAADSAVEAGRQQVDEIKQNAIAKVGEAVVGAVTSPQG